MHISKLLVLLIPIFSCFVNAGSWEKRRSTLEKVAVYDEFRIFYSLSGKDKLPKSHRVDINHNKVPDFIESIGKRLTDSNRFFKYDVGLKNPLNSNRYRGLVHYIDVNVLDFSNNKKGPKNGVAYDGTPKFNRSLAGKTSVKVLTMDISGGVNLNSNTVEHELFHLYQNGYTYFKNRWYTEGTARWSELVIKGRIGKATKLPKTKAAKEKLFKKTYGASSFWNELIVIIDKENLGKSFIKYLLEELESVDDMAARSRGIDNKNWKESEQRSKKNNFYIWQAINSVSKKFPISAEIKNLSLL
ncbi:hypothetical protein [Pseudoalteromonas denitrificans]|uniref:Peptidase n=1 Tax=Pseudoalteromonas denitrificans DSM 6059 TaxID=1123010 RepID=A0A1I1Q021_9GAMM|nr:hypothetical protein [Pseudoalteromonas denitrificans]SFD11510.1 hypothetical protein SAMN02745724_03537 [Pseudoalteromonas denitrificans DSM 6059]